MHRKLKLEALEAELAALRTLFDDASEIEDPVGQIQYEQRIHEIQREIEELRTEEIHQASLALYFGGKPVLGSRGIAADFAGKVLEHFQDIISKQFASNELGGLGERGRVPLKDMTTLMITGVTQGSFGFLLDELSDQMQIFDAALKEMAAEVIHLIESSGSVNEEEFEKAAEDLDPRSLSALRDFFQDLDSNEATVRIVDDTRDLSLDEDAIHRARVRTEATQIDETCDEISGTLLGFLPEHRRFELRPINRNEETIYGSATKEATEQFKNTIINGALAIGRPCMIRVLQRTVRPLNRPPRLVYRLQEFIRIAE